jgi:hypothetical protein
LFLVMLLTSPEYPLLFHHFPPDILIIYQSNSMVPSVEQDLLTHLKLKIEQHEPNWKPWVHSCAPDG